MQSNLVDQPSDQPQKGNPIFLTFNRRHRAINSNLLSRNVKVTIDYDNPIIETVSLIFTKETELKELTKTAVEAFNAVFDSKHLMLKFKENSMDYRLLPSEQNKQIHVTLHTKVSEFEYLQFSLQYNPQDILINFPNNQRRCCACCIII